MVSHLSSSGSSFYKSVSWNSFQVFRATKIPKWTVGFQLEANLPFLGYMAPFSHREYILNPFKPLGQTISEKGVKTKHCRSWLIEAHAVILWLAIRARFGIPVCEVFPVKMLRLEAYRSIMSLRRFRAFTRLAQCGYLQDNFPAKWVKYRYSLFGIFRKTFNTVIETHFSLYIFRMLTLFPVHVLLHWSMMLFSNDAIMENHSLCTIRVPLLEWYFLSGSAEET